LTQGMPYHFEFNCCSFPGPVKLEDVSLIV
jgi:hypothetical protein